MIGTESRNSVGVRRLVMVGKNHTVRELIGHADIATTLRYGPLGTEHSAVRSPRRQFLSGAAADNPVELG